MYQNIEWLYYLVLRAIDGVDPDGVGGREPFV